MLFRRPDKGLQAAFVPFQFDPFPRQGSQYRFDLGLVAIVRFHLESLHQEIGTAFKSGGAGEEGAPVFECIKDVPVESVQIRIVQELPQTGADDEIEAAVGIAGCDQRIALDELG